MLDEILAKSTLKSIPGGTEILREHQYVKVLPIVVEGFVKVYSRFDERELLLYYIEPAQSCVMSFYAALKNTPSRVFAENRGRFENPIDPRVTFAKMAQGLPRI